MRGALAAALLFCIASFIVASFRASLIPETTSNLYDPKRIVLVVPGHDRPKAATAPQGVPVMAVSKHGLTRGRAIFGTLPLRHQSSGNRDA